MYSNAYIFRYAAIMVVVVAAVLSSAATFLKPMQQRNQAIDKMQSILAAAGKQDVAVENAIEVFNANITNMMVIDQDGNVLDDYTGNEKQNSDAFNLNLKTELFSKSQNRPFRLPLYVIDKQGEKTYIIPLLGTGLWGPVWGNIAIKSDFSTVTGVTFDHKSETPGLGAEINTNMFQDQFKGKHLLGPDGKFVSVQVVKGGVSNFPAVQQKHKVDAISGGTITSNGVNDMIENVIESYVPFFKKQG
jgi:Na+-transporting NADH:ubiquinone oxidoreductase subunit C